MLKIGNRLVFDVKICLILNKKDDKNGTITYTIYIINIVHSNFTFQKSSANNCWLAFCSRVQTAAVPISKNTMQYIYTFSKYWTTFGVEIISKIVIK